MIDCEPRNSSKKHEVPATKRKIKRLKSKRAQAAFIFNGHYTVFVAVIDERPAKLVSSFTRMHCWVKTTSIGVHSSIRRQITSTQIRVWYFPWKCNGRKTKSKEVLLQSAGWKCIKSANLCCVFSIKSKQKSHSRWSTQVHSEPSNSSGTGCEGRMTLWCWTTAKKCHAGIIYGPVFNTTLSQ